MCGKCNRVMDDCATVTVEEELCVVCIKDREQASSQDSGVWSLGSELYKSLSNSSGLADLSEN